MSPKTGKAEKPATTSRTARRVLEPVYALVGATELTANMLRDLGAQGSEPTPEHRPLPMLTKLREDVVHIARGTTKIPGVAVGEARSRYAELAQRGHETVANAVPVAKRVRTEGEALARAEDARARREARRLARQAGATVDRGRTLATQAAEDAGRRAERTLGVVKEEASQVVEAVSHPGRAARAVRRPSARRRAAVVDTAVTSTSPAGGEAEAVKTERTTAGVEAGASTTTRRAPRARKAAATKTTETRPAAGRTAKKTTTESAMAGAGTPTAKKTTARKTTPRKTAVRKAPSVAETAAAAPLPTTPAPGSVPTPADVAVAAGLDVAVDSDN